MGLANAKVFRRSATWRFFTHTLGLGSVIVLALMFLPSTAAAQGNIAACGTTISTAGTYTLTTNLTAASGSGPCITIGVGGVTVDLTNGATTYTIDVTQEGDSGVGVDAGNYVNTTIENGTILTDYTTSSADTSAAIEVAGGSGLTITGVHVINEPNGTECGTTQRTNSGYGTGISVSSVSGANISGNSAYCYEYGIYVQGSAIPSKGTGNIAGNDLEGDTFQMSTTSGEVYSAGLVLSASSGWTVSGNTVAYNGSWDDTSLETCSSAIGSLITCSFGLQIVNASSGNSITSNSVYQNFIGGIYTGPDTSGNKIIGNTLSNPDYDMYDSAPVRSNTWRRNTCTSGINGGTVPKNAC